MIDAKIIGIDVQHLRFPRRKAKLINFTSVNPIYICAYVTLKTDIERYKGYALTCELREENVEFVITTCETMFNDIIKDQNVAEIFNDLASFWKLLTMDTKISVGYSRAKKNDLNLHISAAVVVNALWDLWARIEGKPVWKLLTDMTPEQIISLIDFDAIEDRMHVAFGNFSITKSEATEMLQNQEARKKEFEEEIQKTGYPAYAADGWTGCRYSQIYDFSKRYVKSGFETFKVDMDNGKNVRPAMNIQSCFLARRVIGWKKRKLIIHMNHALTPSEANAILDLNLHWYKQETQNKMLIKLRPYCIENVMSTENIYDLDCAEKFSELRYQLRNDTFLSVGEMCSNYAIFKYNALYMHLVSEFWLVNVTRMSGINEVLAVYLWSKKWGVPAWGYANGVGLGEMIQHLQIWDYICVSQTFNKKLIQFADQQHGYFERPVFIQNGNYMPPKFPGYSTKLKDKCISRWSYPEGTRWKHLRRSENLRLENVE